MQMQLQRQQRRQQQSPKAYSPDYSSPMSSQSILQARFDKGSPSRYGPQTKENYPEAPLPIFQDTNTQMIPHVTIGDSDTGCGHVLSDMSDEQLIKQLQLQINSDKQAAAMMSSSNTMFESASQIAASRECSTNQPFQERAINLNLSPTKDSINICQVSNQVKLQDKPKQQPKKKSMQNHSKFVTSKVQTHTWQRQESVSPQQVKSTSARQIKHQRQVSKPENSLLSNRVDQNNRFQQKRAANPPVTHRDRLVFDSVEDHENPIPRPYPMQQFVRSEITDTFEQTQTVTTNQKETSPAISQEDKYKNYVETDSSKKLEQYMAWSSPSPAQKVYKVPNQDVLDVIQVHQFAQNSTIPEQPTEEQLQASGTVTMINYNNRHGSNNASSVQKRQQRSTESPCKSNSQKPGGLEPIQDPQIMMMPSQIQANGPEEGDTNNGLDSESLEQIRMINQAMQTNFPTNFSPDRDDVSDSLKDFSVGCEPRQNNGVAVSNEFYSAAPLVDFGNYIKATTNQGSMINQSQTSMVNHKDSLSTCQNAKQLAMTYFINANMHPETSQCENRLPKGQGADSTLLHPEKSLGSANGALKQFLIEQTTKQTTSSRVGSGHVSRNSQQKSPIRQQRSTLIYGQCQAPSEELYKPILRNTERPSGKKRANEAQQNKQLSQSVKGLPAKLDFGAYTGRQMENAMRQSSNTTSVPNFISPSTTQVGSTRSRGDSKVSIRRNLEHQLNSSKNSLSPVRQASPINSSSGYSKNQLNTMLQKFGINTRSQDAATKKSTTVNHSRATSSRLDNNNAKKQSPSPVLLHRTRNDNVQVTKSCNVTSQQQSQNTTKTDFAAFALQTEQRNLQRKQAQQLQQNAAGSIKLQGNSSRPSINKSAQRSTTPKGRSPVTRTITTHSSRNTLLCSNPQTEQLTQTFRAKPTPQLRASIYQLRRATESMKWLEIQMFLDLERIKKPSAAVLAISRMSCIFFEALRNRDPIIMDQVEGMQSWSQIQEYMRMQLTCCVPELRTLLKQKVVTLGRLNDETPREIDILRSLEIIWETFFTESKIRVIRRFIQTSKLMRGLVHLIYSFVCLALNLEREFNYDNLLGLTEQPLIRFDEVKVIYASALSLASPIAPHQNQPLQKPQSSQHQSKLLLSQQSKSRSREDLQQSLEINNIEIDQNNQSSCSKCSCHLRQSMNNGNQTAKSSFASKAPSGKRSTLSRKSQERSRSPEQYQQVQMEMHVFRTLEQAYMEQLSLNSQQVKTSKANNNNSMSAKYMYQQAEVPKRQRSGSSKRSPQKQSQQHMTYNNYTSVQLPKPYQAKPRTQTPEDLCNVMTIMDQYQAESSRNNIQERITSPTTQNRAGSKPSLTSRPVNRQGSARPSFQKAAPQQDKDTKDVMRRKRKSTISNGSDFVSVVRASAAASMTPSLNHTPKASIAQQKSGTIVSVAHRNAGAATQRQTRKSQNQPLSQNKYQAVPVKRDEKLKRDVSPVTPTSQKRHAPQKAPCSKIMANSVSQNRLMTGSNQVSRNVHANNAQSHGGKHSRTSTLYKSTASASAKQKTAQPQQTTTGRSSMMQRDTSSKSIWTKQQQVFAVQAAMASQQAPQKQLSRKTKSQTNLKLSQQTRRSTTPKEQKNAFSDMLKQQKRQMAQRNIDHLRVVSQQDLDDFIAVEQQTLQLENAPTIESLKPTDSIPSFGGLNIVQTEVLQNNNYMQDTIEEEESSQRLVTKRTATAPVVQASFTPEKIQTFMEVPDSSANPKTPYLQGMMMTGTIQMSSPVQKQAQHGEVLFTNDSLEEPSCAIDSQMPNEQRTHFIMEKAQAITENINSCYKSHNMPKIDMATIQQLKMRRMQFMQQAQNNNDQERQDDDVPKMRRSADPTTSTTTAKPLLQQKTRNKLRNNMPVTMQSCNVMTTMTVEMCDTVSDVDDEAQSFEINDHDDEQRGELEDVSFTEALNKLKAEVACLMQQRTKTNQTRY